VGELPDSAHTHLLVCPVHRQVGCAKSTCFIGMGREGHAAVVAEWESERSKKKNTKEQGRSCQERNRL